MIPMSQSPANFDDAPTLQPARPHIDEKVKWEMTKDIKKNWNPQRQFAHTHQETYKCIKNSEERILMYMRGIHYLHEDLMAHQRVEEDPLSQEGEMMSQPTNASGSKRRNARKRIAHEKNPS
jgi:hypothetical protein